MKKITIVAIDDHKFILEMWRLVFTGNATMEYAGDSGTFDGGIVLIKLKKPDIVLLDINLLEKSGIDAVPLIRKFSPGTKIIVVSMHNEPAYAKKMMHLGAKAYITKNSSHKEVFSAIDTVMKGGIYICTEIKDIIAAQQLNSSTDGPDVRDLSLREIEIIKLIKEGLSSKEIGSSIHIATRTVEVHRHNILKKLKLKNTSSLISFINTTDLTFS
jgi:DNA-binding NarL/FixJ family response regulator